MRKELHRSLNLWPKPGMSVKSSWKPLPTFDPMSQPVKILLLRTLLLKAFRNHCLLPKHGLLPAKRSCKKQKPRWKLARHCCRSCFALRFWKAHLVQIIEKINNYWKSIIMFFQSPISIIIEKFNIHLNNYWNRYWKILKNFASQSELKKNNLIDIFNEIETNQSLDPQGTCWHFCWVLLSSSKWSESICAWWAMEMAMGVAAFEHTQRNSQKREHYTLSMYTSDHVLLVDTSAEFCWVRQNEAKVTNFQTRSRS